MLNFQRERRRRKKTDFRYAFEFRVWISDLVRMICQQELWRRRNGRLENSYSECVSERKTVETRTWATPPTESYYHRVSHQQTLIVYETHYYDMKHSNSLNKCNAIFHLVIRFVLFWYLCGRYSLILEITLARGHRTSPTFGEVSQWFSRIALRVYHRAQTTKLCNDTRTNS